MVVPAGMFWIWQAATPTELTVIALLAEPTQVAAEPLSRKVIFPTGRTGVSVVPVNAAVNVTTVFNAEGLGGEGSVAVKLMVGCSAVTV